MTMMRMKINLDAERRIRLVADFIVMIVCIIATTLTFGLTYRFILMSHLFYVNAGTLALTFLFICAFEEYGSIVTPFNEKVIVFVLSGVYSSLVSFVVLYIFSDFIILTFNCIALIAVTTVMLIITNCIIEKFLKNEKYILKQKLLILLAENGNESRVKRIKNGTLSRFDSRYEFIDINHIESVEKLIAEKFNEYDAICVLDNISDGVYKLLCVKAMEYGKELYVVPKVIDINKSKVKTVKFDDVLAFYIPDYSLRLYERIFKRVCDIVVSVIALIVFALPMLVIALLIKVTSPGKVIYKQLRLTKNKKEFYIYKFRTMVDGAEDKTGPVFAQKNDPRATKVGKVLRRLRLDELPQFYNVLKGDMSLVGPRPERPEFVEQFEKNIDYYDYRFAVKAGMTALSHVYGRYTTSIEDRTCYDLMYIINYSILLDLKILLLTTKTIFVKGASDGEDVEDDTNSDNNVVAQIL